jgi:hypothetical protein
MTNCSRAPQWSIELPQTKICTRAVVHPNMPVNADAHSRPLAAVAPFRGRRLRLR